VLRRKPRSSSLPFVTGQTPHETTQCVPSHITLSNMPLPRRQWVAKFTPDTLETYLTDPNPTSRLRQAHTIWSDEFDNIISPAPQDDAPGLSRAQLCRLRNNDAVLNHSGYTNKSFSLLQGFRPSHLLFTDDCFLDGLLEGFGLILVIVSMLAASVAFSILIRRRIGSWKAGQRHGSSNSLSRPYGSQSVIEGVDEKTKAVAYVEVA